MVPGCPCLSVTGSGAVRKLFPGNLQQLCFHQLADLSNKNILSYIILIPSLPPSLPFFRYSRLPHFLFSSLPFQGSILQLSLSILQGLFYNNHYHSIQVPQPLFQEATASVRQSVLTVHRSFSSSIPCLPPEQSLLYFTFSASLKEMHYQKTFITLFPNATPRKIIVSLPEIQ